MSTVLDPTNARVSTRLRPDGIIPVGQTPYANSSEELATTLRCFKAGSVWPQYSRANIGANQPWTRIEHWVFTSLFERKFSYLGANAGGGVTWSPEWNGGILYAQSHAQVGSGPISLYDTLYNAPLAAGTLTFNDAPRSGPINIPTSAWNGFGLVAASANLGWGWIGTDANGASIPGFISVGNTVSPTDMDVWGFNPLRNNIQRFQQAWFILSGFSIMGHLPELRKYNGFFNNSLTNFMFASRSLGELRPRIYEYILQNATGVIGYNIHPDDPTMDGFFNTANVGISTQPTIAPGNEGWIITIGGTFEGTGPKFVVWLSEDGLYWRLWRPQAMDANAVTALAGGNGLFAQDPLGNWFYGAPQTLGGQLFSSFGFTLSLPYRTLPTFPPLSLPCSQIKECCP